MQARSGCRTPALSPCGRYFHRLPPTHSLRVRQPSYKRYDWVLVTTEEIRISNRRSHNCRRNSIFPYHQLCVVGVIDWKLSEECGGLSGVLCRGPAIILEHT